MPSETRRYNIITIILVVHSVILNVVKNLASMHIHERNIVPIRSRFFVVPPQNDTVNNLINFLTT